MFSYQCSQLSTPESVLEVFGTATKFQKNKDTSRFVSVVVLDEVGLAEDSPSLPLKALHPLLEDGTSGADSQVTITHCIVYCKRGTFCGGESFLHGIYLLKPVEKFHSVPNFIIKA